MFCKKCGYPLMGDEPCCPACGTPAHAPESEKNTDDTKKDDFWDNSNWIYKKEEQKASDNQASAAQDSGFQNGFDGYNNNSGGQSFDQSYSQNNSRNVYQNTVTPQNYPKNKNKNKTAFIIILLVIALLILGMITGTVLICTGFRSTIDSITELSSDIAKDLEDYDFNLDDFSINNNDEDSFIPEEDSSSNEDNSDELDDSGEWDYYKGTIDGYRYENQFLGIAYDIPFTYYVYDEAELETLSGDTLEDGFVCLDVVDEYIDEMQLYVVEYPYYTPEAFINDLVETANETYEGEYYIDEESREETVAGMDFLAITMETVNYDPEENYRYSEFYVSKKDDVIVVLKFYYDEPENKEKMLLNFEAI